MQDSMIKLYKLLLKFTKTENVKFEGAGKERRKVQ